MFDEGLRFEDGLVYDVFSRKLGPAIMQKRLDSHMKSGDLVRVTIHTCRFEYRWIDARQYPWTEVCYSALCFFIRG